MQLSDCRLCLNQFKNFHDKRNYNFRWAFGTHLCFILGYGKHAFYVAEFCLIILMGLCRLFCLYRPLSPVLTPTTVRSLVSLIWAGSTIYITTWPFTSAGVFYQALLGCCMPALQPAPPISFLQLFTLW